MPLRMPGSVRKALTDVREALPDIWQWSGDHPGFAEVVGRPSRMSESAMEVLPDVRVS